MGADSLPLLVADVGKTRCRVRLLDAAGEVLWASDGAGTPGLAVPGSGEIIVHRLVELSDGRPSRKVSAISVGVAGAMAARTAADALATGLAHAFQASSLVASDIVTAHLGAFGGGPGTALVAGTGAVALSVSANGTATVIDGKGPELGDLGGGAWIGRAGIVAVLRADDAAAPATVLQSGLREIIGPGGDLQRWLADGGNLGGRLGEFAAMVLDSAELGDSTAEAIAADAVRHLTTTARTAGSTRVAVLGGLTGHRWFHAQLEASLAAAGLTPFAPIGTALDGARIAVTAQGLPHERHLHRV